MNNAQNVALSPVEIKELRKTLRMTQGELAEKLGYSRNYCTLLETGDKPVTLEFTDKLKALVEEANSQQGLTIREGASSWDYSPKPPATAAQVAELKAECAGMKTQMAAMQTKLDTIVSLLGASLHIGAPVDKPADKKVG